MILNLSIEDIEKLKDIELVKLLSILLYLEAKNHSIPLNKILVPHNINAPDGGEDGIIIVDKLEEESDFIFVGSNVFQVKATEMSPQDCYDEMRSDKESIKPNVKKVLDEDGTYILFYNKALVSGGVRKAIFKKGAKKAGQEKVSYDGIEGRKEKIKKYLVEINSKYKKAKVEIYDANKICAWASQYISAIVYVLSTVGKTIPLGLKNWAEWSNYSQFKTTYVETKYLSKQLASLRKELSKEKSIIRIFGPSGLGRTRLALETLKPQEFQSGVVYIDASITRGDDIISSISMWTRNKLKGIVVIDDCPAALHDKLREETQRVDCYLTLVTVGHESISTNNTLSIQLVASEENNEIILKMIKSKISNISSINIDSMVKYASGYPKVAELLIEFYTNNFDLGLLSQSTLTKKLLFGNVEPSDEIYNVVQAVSLFSSIGYIDDLEHQYEFVAKEICNIEPSRFFMLLKRHFSSKGLIQYYGRYLMFTPAPIAWALAVQWFDEQHPSTLERIIIKILSSTLVERFMNRTLELKFSENVVKCFNFLILNFKNEPELFFDSGRQKLFDCLIDINYELSFEVFEQNFIAIQQGIRQIKPLRGPLSALFFANALKKFCSYSKVAEKSFPLWAKFIEQTEGLQIFQSQINGDFTGFFYLVSNTDMPIDKRLKLLNIEIQKYPDNEYISLMFIDALINFIKMEGHTQYCWSGVPKIQRDVWELTQEFWEVSLPGLLKEAFVTLMSYAESQNNKIAKQASIELVKNISKIYRCGLLEELEKYLAQIRGNSAFDGEIIRTFLDYCRHNYKRDENKISFDKLIDIWSLLRPSTVEEKIKFYVTSYWSDYVYDCDGTILKNVKEIYLEPQYFIKILTNNESGSIKQGIFLSAELGKELARDIANDNIMFDGLLNNINVLFTPINDMAVPPNLKSFAETMCLQLYEIDAKDKIKELVERSLDYINTYNGSMQILFLSVIFQLTYKHDPIFFNGLLESILKKENCKWCYLMLFNMKIDLSEMDMDLLLQFINTNPQHISGVSKFFPRLFENKSEETTNNFIDVLIKIGNKGIYELFDFVVGGDKKLSIYFNKILISIDINSLLENKEYSYLEKWSICCVKHMSDSAHEEIEKFIEPLFEKIRAVFSYSYDTFFFYTCENHPNFYELLYYLIEKFEQRFWPYLKDVLEKNKHFFGSNLSGFNFIGRSHPIVDRLSLNCLQGWCKESPVYAPEFLAENASLIEEKEDQYNWTGFFMFLIDAYGHMESIIRKIDINIGNYAWTGSKVGLLQNTNDLFQGLGTHKFENVRKWAREKRGKINNQEIPYEKNIDAEYEFEARNSTFYSQTSEPLRGVSGKRKSMTSSELMAPNKKFRGVNMGANQEKDLHQASANARSKSQIRIKVHESTSSGNTTKRYHGINLDNEKLSLENYNESKIHHDLQRFLERNNLGRVEIQGDGHCLYNAVSLYLGIGVKTLRNNVADYIENNRTILEPQILALIEPLGINIESYVNSIRNREWADSLEISVLEMVYGRPIVIIGPNGEPRNINDNIQSDPIYVFYNGHSHYDGLVRVEAKPIIFSGSSLSFKSQQPASSFSDKDLWIDEAKSRAGLQKYKANNKSNHPYCSAMDRVVMKSLGYELGGQVEADTVSINPSWCKKRAARELDKTFVIEELKTTLLAELRFAADVPTARLDEFYNQYLQIIGKEPQAVPAFQGQGYRLNS